MSVAIYIAFMVLTAAKLFAILSAREAGRNWSADFEIGALLVLTVYGLYWLASNWRLKRTLREDLRTSRDRHA
jgi:hypothetical protein